MRFTSLATFLMIAVVSQTEAVEIKSEAHAQGLKAPHRVPKQLAQVRAHKKDWKAMANKGINAATDAGLLAQK